jgi:hypothetical protein
MSEAILKALMQLFALIVDIDEIQEISEKEREIIHSFLSRQLNSELTEKYMGIFENYLLHYHQHSLDRESVKQKREPPSPLSGSWPFVNRSMRSWSRSRRSM